MEVRLFVLLLLLVAESKWDALSNEEKQQHEEAMIASVKAIQDLIRNEISLWSDFSAYDILWFVLAAGAAAGVVLKGDDDG